MIAVSDSSPLISLAKLDRIDTLRLLFPILIITKQVLDEVVTRGDSRAGAYEVSAASWIHVRPLIDESLLTSAAQALNLGLGETSAILLGKQLGADILLIDETRARRFSVASGLRVVGCVGLLEQFHRRGFTPDLRADFQRLAEVSYVDTELLNRRLRALNLAPL